MSAAATSQQRRQSASSATQVADAGNSLALAQCSVQFDRAGDVAGGIQQ